jgi:hypothetical protein
MKACACGLTHSAASWRELPLIGRQDDGVEVLELRNCACRSTLAVVVGPGSEMLDELSRLFRAEASTAACDSECERLRGIADELLLRSLAAIAA